MSARTTDESFEELYHEAPFGYLTTDPHDVIVLVNRTLLHWIDQPESAVVGRRFAELLDAGGRLFYENRHLPVLMIRGDAREVSLSLRRRDGSDMPVLLNAAMVRDERDAPRVVRIAVFDATTRERYERELLAAQRGAEASANRVTVLQNASALFGTATSESELAAGFASIVSDALAATESCVAMLKPDDSFEVIAGVNPLEGLVPLGARRPGLEAARTERPLVVTATDEVYTDVAAALRQQRLHSLIAIPILRSGAAMGVVAAFFGRERDLDPDEVALVVAITQQAGQTLTRIRLQDELAHLALHDQLTGLANRLLLREHIGQSLAVNARSSTPLSIMFIDLDGFKAVNDKLGHVTGDAVLREVAERVRAVIRDSDVVGRYGGDEFVVICTDTDAVAAEGIADRIRDAIRRPFAQAPGFAITASIGIAVNSTGDAASTDHLIDVADSAMYTSKHSGRDKATVALC